MVYQKAVVKDLKLVAVKVPKWVELKGDSWVAQTVALKVELLADA